MAEDKIFNDNKKTGSLVDGFKSIFDSFKLMSENEGFLKFFIVPFLLNIVILTTIYYFSFTYLSDSILNMLSGDSWYMAALRFVLKPLVFVMIGFITIILYSIIGVIVVSPFNDFISLKVEGVMTGEDLDEPFSLVAVIKDITRTIGNILKMLGLVIVINLVLLLINFLPFIGTIIYTVLSFMVTAFFLGFQFFDFPLERRRFIFGEKLKITMQYKWSVIGLGAGFFLISFIPIVGFLGLNLGAVGGTMVFIDHIKPRLKNPGIRSA